MGLLLVRITIGIIFLVHGIQKFKMWKMQPSEQLPAPMLTIMRILSVAEPLGGLALLGGFLTRIAAAGIGIIMLGAMDLKIRRLKRKFTGDGGWELDLILLGVALLLILTGAGHISVDALIW